MHIRATVATDPEAGWIFVLDQLNIHRSESLVRFVAQQCEIKLDLGEKGNQGIKKIHTSSYTPIKKKKEKALALREKEYNRELAKQRIYIEHVIRCLKIFRILAQPYRNRRRRFGLRFNLIAGLYNRGLDLALA